MKTNVVKWHRRCCQDAHPQKLSSSATAINNCRGCVDAVRTNDSTFWYNDKATAYSDWSRLSLFHVETGKYKQSPLIKARKYFRWFSFGDETKSLLGRRTTQPHQNKMKVVAPTWQAWRMSLINYLQSIGDCFQDNSNSFLNAQFIPVSSIGFVHRLSNKRIRSSIYYLNKMHFKLNSFFYPLITRGAADAERSCDGNTTLHFGQANFLSCSPVHAHVGVWYLRDINLLTYT